MGSVISGTGMSVPDIVVTNVDLTRIMDTSDEWITSRTGVEERRFAAPGIGSSDLGADAARAAMTDAGVEASDIDALIAATMTPDVIAPGISPLIQQQLGIGAVAAYDIRQQCSGFLYSLDLADSLLATNKASRVLVVGAETHGGYLPWGRTWDYLTGASDIPPTEEEYSRNTEHRGWSVLFGDGAGAMIVEAGPDHAGWLGCVLRTDGSMYDLIHVPGPGFRNQPWIDREMVDADGHLPEMRGGDLFRAAVELMPEAVESVLDGAGLKLSDVDVVVSHQANARITDAVRRRLGLSEQVVPSNIAKYGNTTAGTLPILYHEMKQEGRFASGALVCFTAFGSGAHWGAGLYRVP